MSPGTIDIRQAIEFVPVLQAVEAGEGKHEQQAERAVAPKGNADDHGCHVPDFHQAHQHSYKKDFHHRPALQVKCQPGDRYHPGIVLPVNDTGGQGEQQHTTKFGNAKR